MATKLKVSRGSFYWHFRDMADFRSQVLRSWEETSTDQVIKDLNARQGEPGRLRQLLQQGIKGRRRLDRAIRAWATEDEVVADVVASVDTKRIGGIARLLVEAGVERKQAVHRATFVYWAYLGQAAVMDANHSSLTAPAFADIARLLET
jgi:AcrR family transcriptional regulator